MTFPTRFRAVRAFVITLSLACVACVLPAAAFAAPTNVQFAAPGAGQLQDGLVYAKVTWTDADRDLAEHFRVGSSPTNLGVVDSQTFFLNTAGLPDGPQSFTPVVKYESSASFFSGTPITLYVDNTAPTATVADGPANGAEVHPGAQVFTVTASDGYYAAAGVSEVRCSLTDLTSGVVLADLSCKAARSFTTGDLELGSYRFSVTASDRRNHRSAAATRTFSVVPVPPVVTPPVVAPAPEPAPAAAASPAPRVETAPNAAAAVVTKAPVRYCVVPILRGYTLAAAKVRLARAGCAVGQVTRARGLRTRVGKVSAQGIAAGTVLASGRRVGLRVGR
ncbi:MAG: hypothetical protein JWN72_2868 [Thermoleophilia bacterium]|nr:hypothetical protein [Thermoleophilia bacterium]